MHWLIATDLDGTLLDDGYRLEAAAAAIDALFWLRPVAAGLVKLHVVLATSKTFVEAVTLAGHCACDPVLAFENGAGLAWRTVACAARGTAPTRRLRDRVPRHGLCPFAPCTAEAPASRGF